MANRKESLQTCLNLLCGSKDEQRVAGLLLLPRCMQGCPKEDIPTGFCNQVFSVLTQPTVASSFLYRLLHTKTPGYRELALNIIEVLVSQDVAVTLNPSMREIFPICFGFIVTESTEASALCYRLLLATMSAAGESFLPDYYPSGGLDSLLCCKNGYLALPDGEDRTRVFSAICNILASQNERLSVSKSSLEQIVKYISTHTDLSMFDSLYILSEIFNCQPIMNKLKDDISVASEDWVSLLQYSFMRLVLNRLRDRDRNSCFVIGHTMLRLFGPSWISVQIPEEVSVANKHAYLIDIFAQLLQTELRLLVQEDIHQNKKYESPILHHFATCLDVVELCIDFLDRYDEWQLLPGPVLVRLTSSIVNCVVSALHFVHHIEFEHKEGANILLLKSFRIIGSWFSRDVEYYVEDFAKALPVLEEKALSSDFAREAFNYLVPGISKILRVPRFRSIFFKTKIGNFVLFNLSSSIKGDIVSLSVQLKKPVELPSEEVELAASQLVDYVPIDTFILNQLYISISTLSVKSGEINSASDELLRLSDDVYLVLESIKKHTSAYLEIYLALASLYVLLNHAAVKKDSMLLNEPRIDKVVKVSTALMVRVGKDLLDMKSASESDGSEEPSEEVEDSDINLAQTAFGLSALLEAVNGMCAESRFSAKLVSALSAKDYLNSKKILKQLAILQGSPSLLLVDNIEEIMFNMSSFVENMAPKIPAFASHLQNEQSKAFEIEVI